LLSKRGFEPSLLFLEVLGCGKSIGDPTVFLAEWNMSGKRPTPSEMKKMMIRILDHSGSVVNDISDPLASDGELRRKQEIISVNPSRVS
jgi:hypothetical protein